MLAGSILGVFIRGWELYCQVEGIHRKALVPLPSFLHLIQGPVMVLSQNERTQIRLQHLMILIGISQDGSPPILGKPPYVWHLRLCFSGGLSASERPFAAGTQWVVGIRGFLVRAGRGK